MLDLMMPEMDGFEFLVEMRSRSEWNDLPVLVVTAKDLTAEERSRLNGDVERGAPKKRDRARRAAAGDRTASARSRWARTG
jgi:CheY-like chemotaxis protein